MYYCNLLTKLYFKYYDILSTYIDKYDNYTTYISYDRPYVLVCVWEKLAKHNGVFSDDIKKISIEVMQLEYIYNCNNYKVTDDLVNIEMKKINISNDVDKEWRKWHTICEFLDVTSIHPKNVLKIVDLEQGGHLQTLDIDLFNKK